MNDDKRIADITKRVSENASRVAELGGWPSWMDPQESLTGRVPDAHMASGFDAGIACCMDIIPRDKQRLSAILHGAYTPEAVEQIRRENDAVSDADSEVTWWLAMSSICLEDGGHPIQEASSFLDQVDRAARIASDARSRMDASEVAMESLRDSYIVMDQVSYGDTDGCQQAAYIDGIDLAVMYASEYGIWFIGTFRPSLGLEDFEWSTEVDDQERQKSGPVHGSSQFVKASSLSELAAAVESAKRHMGI